MENQNQLSFGWLLAPTGGGSGILFCNANPDHQGITTVPTPVLMSMENNRVNKVMETCFEESHHHHLQQQLHLINSEAGIDAEAINFDVIPKDSNHNDNHQHTEELALPVPQPLLESLQSVLGSEETAQKSENITSEKRIMSSDESNTPVVQRSPRIVLCKAEALAKRRETNRLREKMRREQMTPKERAKQRKKNRLRARKRRRDMTPEEREQEKEKNRERARERRAQKLKQLEQHA